MIAAQGDLAVAVFVDEGESGSGTAGPILESFLREAGWLSAAPAGRPGRTQRAQRPCASASRADRRARATLRATSSGIGS